MSEVLLEIPAQPEFVFLARVTAAKLASRQEFDISEIEDLRLALDEVLAAVNAAADPSGTVRITFEDTNPGLRIRGEASAASTEMPKLSEWSELILDALVDEHEVGSSDGRPSFELLKKHTGG